MHLGTWIWFHTSRHGVVYVTWISTMHPSVFNCHFSVINIFVITGEVLIVFIAENIQNVQIHFVNQLYYHGLLYTPKRIDLPLLYTHTDTPTINPQVCTPPVCTPVSCNSVLLLTYRTLIIINCLVVFVVNAKICTPRVNINSS